MLFGKTVRIGCRLRRFSYYSVTGWWLKHSSEKLRYSV